MTVVLYKNKNKLIQHIWLEEMTLFAISWSWYDLIFSNVTHMNKHKISKLVKHKQSWCLDCVLLASAEIHLHLAGVTLSHSAARSPHSSDTKQNTPWFNGNNAIHRKPLRCIKIIHLSLNSNYMCFLYGERRIIYKILLGNHINFKYCPHLNCIVLGKMIHQLE